MESRAGKFITVAMFALLLAAVLSLVVNAASGPSAAGTVKKEETQIDSSRLGPVVAATWEPQPKAGEVSSEEAAKYKCSSVDTMRERIKCRLQLAEENEYDYLPEECRAQVNESREKCVANYKKSQQCWTSLKDSDRFKCAASAFGLVGTVASQKAQCDDLTGQNRSDCILQLRDRVDAAVKFRIYNLEDKAQHLMEKGMADQETVTGFVTAMEQQKQNYNDAKTAADKKAIVKGVQKLWQGFIAKVKK